VARHAHIDQVDPFTGRELRAILAAAERLEPDFAVMLRVWSQSGMQPAALAAPQQRPGNAR
jgi:hypothetical protein